MKIIFVLSLVLINVSVFGQTMNDINIVPVPAEMKVQPSAKFEINNNTELVLEGSGLERSATFFNDYLQQFYGFKLKMTKKNTAKNAIILNYERLDNILPGAYTLKVNNNGVSIAGDNETGVFYGIQTLLQLLPVTVNYKQPILNHILSIPQIEIKDYPRFAYRGMHLDVCRHFFPVDYVKKYIDYLAFYKFNTFHWHLTDDQGWRIEIKKYPKLTAVGSCRKRTLIGRYGSNKYDSIRYCGYYTQDDIKEIVKYAADRYITVIPEIEMPGHATAALASYPFLGCTKGPYEVMDTWGGSPDPFCPGNDSTYTFLENVLDEVMQLFPSKYIHIGGDECPKERWKTCPVCQKRIKTEGLKNEHELQSYFVRRIEKYINGKGRQIIGWDEILEGGLAPNATVMSWRGEEGGITAARQQHNVIMTPGTYCYLDHSQSKNEDSVTIGGYLPLETVYNYEPIPKQLNAQEAKYIMGAQGNLWTEYISNPRKVEYMIFPRMSALSEVLWSPKGKRDWQDFQRRLPVTYTRYREWGTNYSTAFYDLQSSILPTTNYNGVLLKLESKSKNGKIIYVKGLTTNATFNYSDPILISASGNYGGALTAANHKIISNWLWQTFSFNKATGKKITLKDQPASNYPGSGAFTLVNGIITEKKLSQSSEWLGFLGKDIEAVVDLGSNQDINGITLDVLNQEGSWIYLPASVEFLTSENGQNFSPQGILKPGTNGNWLNERKIGIKLHAVTARYVKVIAKNFGIIPAGKPGSGTAAWLFADEIEVQ